MNQISDYNQVLDAVKSVKELRIGFKTNLFLDKERINIWINKGVLFIGYHESSIYFLKQNDNFFNLYYITTDSSSISGLLKHILLVHSDKLIVTDLIGKEPFINNIHQLFSKEGFYQYTSLQRMSRLLQEKYLDEASTNVCLPSFENSSEIFRILQTYFDPLAEQLPYIEEIEKWVENGSVRVVKDGNKIIGFVIFEINGLTSYLRYWFVHPDYRNRNVGSDLLRSYFKASNNTKRQLFWVIKTNQNAIIRYLHYGFETENLLDYVMINKNMSYEK